MRDFQPVPSGRDWRSPTIQKRPLPGFPGDNLLVIFMRLTEKLVFPHGNDESAPSILMGWRAAATSIEPQLALPPVATRNGPAQPMRIGAGTASKETAKLEASGWGWVHRCFRSIKFPPEIPEEPKKGDFK
jgi:hypothetical protein